MFQEETLATRRLRMEVVVKIEFKSPIFWKWKLGA